VHAALSTSDPAGSLEFRAHEPQKLQRYRFAQRTADFLLCRECGVYVGAVISTPRGRFGIVNTRVLQPQPEDLAAAVPISYDAETGAERVSRRESRWTPVAAAP
jgi:hypothetical protein